MTEFRSNADEIIWASFRNCKTFFNKSLAWEVQANRNKCCGTCPFQTFEFCKLDNSKLWNVEALKAWNPNTFEKKSGNIFEHITSMNFEVLNRLIHSSIDYQFWFMANGSRLMAQGSWLKAHGSRPRMFLALGLGLGGPILNREPWDMNNRVINEWY